MNSGISAEWLGLTSPIEAGFSGTHWPIAASYELRNEQRLTAEVVVYRTGPDRAYRVFGPVAVEPELEILATSSDEAILQWIQEHGFVGIAGDRAATSETISTIRTYAAHLGSCRALLEALSNGRTASPRLLDLARSAAGHLVDPAVLRRGLGPTGLDEPVAQADAHLQAFYALAATLRDQVTRLTRVTASIDKTEDGHLVLRPRLLAAGPLSAAYLELLSSATRIAVVWDREAPTVHRTYPMTCHWCRRPFAGRRADAKYCSKRCRWNASKANRPTVKDGGIR